MEENTVGNKEESMEESMEGSKEESRVKISYNLHLLFLDTHSLQLAFEK